MSKNQTIFSIKQLLDQLLNSDSVPGEICVSIKKNKDEQFGDNKDTYDVKLDYLDDDGLIIRSQSTRIPIKLEQRHTTPTNLSSFVHALRDLLVQYFY